MSTIAQGEKADTGKKRTIIDCVSAVLAESKKPLSLYEIFQSILDRKLYNFGAKYPIEVVRVEIMRNCENTVYSKGNQNPIFFLSLNASGQRVFSLIANKNTNSESESPNDVCTIIDHYINEKISLYNLHKEVNDGIYGIWIAPNVNRLFKVKHQIKSTRFEFREKTWFPNRFINEIPKGDEKQYNGFKVSWLEEPYNQNEPCNMIVTVFDFPKAKPYLDKFIEAAVEAASNDINQTTASMIKREQEVEESDYVAKQGLAKKPVQVISEANNFNLTVLFGTWLKKKGNSDVAINNHISSLYSIEAFANEHGIENINLTTDYGTAISSIERMLGNKEFIKFNIEHHNRFSTTFRKMRDFISENERHETFRNSDIELEARNPVLYKKLYSISKVYDDPQGISVSHILRVLGMSISEVEVSEFLDLVSWAVKKEDFVYSFSKKSVDKDGKAISESIVKEKPSVSEKDKLIKVLLQRYQNGMQFDSIDMENFRDTYFELFDKELQYPDEQLIERLKCCGIIYKDRLFPAEGIIDNTTKERLFAYIESSFSTGNKVLYYKSIYTDLEDAFAYRFNLSDEKMLQVYIEHEAEKGKYFFYNDYMSVEKDAKINPLKEIIDYMLSIGKPLSYEDIYNGLPHISHDIIYREIQMNSCFLRNEKEHYFHIDIFEFSTEDAEHISSLLDKEIEENGYAIWSRIFKKIQEQIPTFLENNLYLSSLGIRNALSRHMSNLYNFESEVISTHDKCLSMADVYRLYGKHNTPFSDDDINAFSKELGTTIYFVPLAEETVRVSKKLFVAKDDIFFNVEAIDAALATYLSSGYILIKDVNSFLVFPSVGYEWNEFLLESYLRSYSQKFALISNGFSLNNVAGAMVKKDGEYTQFFDICAHALAESDVQLTKESALNYLVEINLITRRSYRELDSALLMAKQIRSRKG